MRQYLSRRSDTALVTAAIGQNEASLLRLRTQVSGIKKRRALQAQRRPVFERHGKEKAARTVRIRLGAAFSD